MSDLGAKADISQRNRHVRPRKQTSTGLEVAAFLPKIAAKPPNDEAD
jgi:hypothetical protein